MSLTHIFHPEKWVQSFYATHKPRIRQRLKKSGIATDLQIAIGNSHLSDAMPLLYKLHEVEHLCPQVRRQGCNFRFNSDALGLNTAV